MFKFQIISGLAAAALTAAPALATDYAPVRVEVANVRDAKGHVRVDVCTQHTFLKDCAYSGAAPATVGVTTVVVPNVPPGRYAVQAYHDENDNHKVDQGLLGIPREAVGFSRDAPIRMLPPRFHDAMFMHGEQPDVIHLHLRRFP